MTYIPVFIPIWLHDDEDSDDDVELGAGFWLILSIFLFMLGIVTYFAVGGYWVEVTWYGTSYNYLSMALVGGGCFFLAVSIIIYVNDRLQERKERNQPFRYIGDDANGYGR